MKSVDDFVFYAAIKRIIQVCSSAVALSKFKNTNS